MTIIKLVAIAVACAALTACNLAPKDGGSSSPLMAMAQGWEPKPDQSLVLTNEWVAKFKGGWKFDLFAPPPVVIQPPAMVAPATYLNKPPEK